MITVNTVRAVKREIKKARADGKTVGFVPTMGYLHEGHLSLMKRAKKENDVVVISIFVNPTQFGPDEDLESYPRNLKKDSEMASSVGADILFAPDAEEMYPDGYATSVEVEGDITRQLCGKSRPGHFKGVTTVVAKFFNIIRPDKAYFGQKDAQQLAVIEKMVRDLNFEVEIIPCPIVREKDGLAISSRNIYLNDSERQDALVLSRSLFEAEEMIKKGEKDAVFIKEMIINNIKAEQSVAIDYVKVVNSMTLLDIDKIEGDFLIALAVKIGKTRLIDNIRGARNDS